MWILFPLLMVTSFTGREENRPIFFSSFIQHTPAVIDNSPGRSNRQQTQPKKKRIHENQENPNRLGFTCKQKKRQHNHCAYVYVYVDGWRWAAVLFSYSPLAGSNAVFESDVMGSVQFLRTFFGFGL